MEEQNTRPNEFGWYDASQVQPCVKESDNSESNVVLVRTEGNIIPAIFYVVDTSAGGFWIKVNGTCLDTIEDVTHWMPLPKSVVFQDDDGNGLRPASPWVGKDKHFGDEGAPNVRFWDEQRAIENAEFAEKDAPKAECAV